jgi:hypothetical protein
MDDEIRLNWTESDLSGCFLLAVDGQVSIYLASRVTLQEVYIKTTLSVSLQSHILRIERANFIC